MKYEKSEIRKKHKRSYRQFPNWEEKEEWFYGSVSPGRGRLADPHCATSPFGRQ
jgi:hypothetical protein